MLIVGLTGSIGSGKSLATKCFQALGIPVHDSDAEVHTLLRDNQELIHAIADRWPTGVEKGQVVRHKLGEIVFADPRELKRLEKMIYPYLFEVHSAFLSEQAAQGTPLVVIDMPLLFETGFDQHMDVSVCVIADDALRLERVLRRDHMTEKKFKARDALQIPQEEKRKRADVVLTSGGEKSQMMRQVEELVHSLRNQKGIKWGPQWDARLKGK